MAKKASVNDASKLKLNKVRFFHIRWLENEGILSTYIDTKTGKEFKFTEYTIGPRGGATFAFKIIHTKGKEDKALRYRIKFGMAKCNWKDNFCKKTGRDLALERLESNNENITLSFAEQYTPDIEDIFFNLFETYYKDQEKFIGNIRDIVFNKDELEITD